MTAILSNRGSAKSQDGSSMEKSGDGTTGPSADGDDEDSKLQSLIKKMIHVHGNVHCQNLVWMKVKVHYLIN